MIKVRKLTVKEKLEATKTPAKKRKAKNSRPVKNQRGTYYNSGYVSSIMLHRSSHTLLSSMCPKNATYQQFILRAIQVLSDKGLLDKVTNFDYKSYPKFKVE